MLAMQWSVLIVLIALIFRALPTCLSDVSGVTHRKLVRGLAGQAVDKQYLIQFREDHFAFDAAKIAGYCRAFGAQVLYQHKAFEIVSVAFVSTRLLLRILHEDSVLVVEEDHYYEQQSVQSQAPWHLDRIDQWDLPLNFRYYYNKTGTGVKVYILDSGVKADHPGLEGRTSCGWDVYDDGCNDGSGHGTHVAGVVGGSFHGVAKKADMVSVRVLDSTGSGRASDILAGLDYVRQDKESTSQPVIAMLAVGNVQQGFFKSLLIRSAINRTWRQGTLVVVAAGNGGKRTFDDSTFPAVTVGAATRDNRRADFSNYGPFLDVFAPGVNVTSLSGTTRSHEVRSGTSVAAAVVAGVAALYLEQYPDSSPRQIRNMLRAHAAENRLSAVGLGSPNLLVSTADLLGFDRSDMPSMSPTQSIRPSGRPSDVPSLQPSYSSSPSGQVSVSPSASPTVVASTFPSSIPSISVPPSSAPSEVNCGYPTAPFYQECFRSRDELLDAVDAYLSSDSPDTVTAKTYGWPIGTWCIDCVTDLSRVFSLERNDNATKMDFNVNGWNVSRVTSLHAAFKFANNFNQPLTDWDVSNVVDMSFCFDGAKAFDQHINSWDVSKVVTISYMFYGAITFNKPLSDWNTVSVRDMSYSFDGTTAFNQPLDNWDTSSVTDMRSMFAQSSFNSPLASWNVTSVRSMRAMFWYAESFQQDLSSWNVVGLADMHGMFYSSGIDTSLCAWGTRLSPTTIVDFAFRLTDCEDVSDPGFDVIPPGPFCAACA